MNSVWRKTLVVLAVSVSLLLVVIIHRLPYFSKLGTADRELYHYVLNGGVTVNRPPQSLLYLRRERLNSLNRGTEVAINSSVKTMPTIISDHDGSASNTASSKAQKRIAQLVTTTAQDTPSNIRATVPIYQLAQPMSQKSTPWKRRKSYMLALHTAEQLTMSTYHFIEFLNMVHQWNFTGVEPFVYRSRMFALRSMHQGDINGSVHYHRLLNTTFMREKLSKCLQKSEKLAQNITTKLFVPVKEFMCESQRKLCLVYFSKHMNVIDKQLHSNTDFKLQNIAKEPVLECTQTLIESGMASTVEGLLNQELLIENKSKIENFTVVQSFCIMPNVKLSLIDIKKYILSHIQRDALGEVDTSIVFVSWQGRFTRPFTDMGTVHRCALPADRIPPSSEVVSATDRFLQSQGLQHSSYIAVHIRFEKLFDQVYKQNNSRQLLQCCMFKLDAVLRRMKEQYNLTTECSTLLLHDYSRYGSDSCLHDGRWANRDVCVKDAQNLLSILNETKAVEFDPIKFNTPQNAGFVSRVEGLSLNGGRVLVVIGGGSYQTSIVNCFREEHSSQKEPVVYRLCAKVDETFPGVDFDKIKDCTVTH